MSIEKILKEKYGKTSDIGQDAGVQGAAIMVYLEAEHESVKKIKKGMDSLLDNMKTVLSNEILGEKVSKKDCQAAAADLIFLHKTLLGAFMAQIGVRYIHDRINNIDDLWKSYAKLSEVLKVDPGSRKRIEEDVETMLEEFRNELSKKAQS